MMKVAYDMHHMKPACVLVAASMGADTQAAMAFDPHHWLLVPTKHMKVYETTDLQLKQLIKETEMKHEPGGN